MADLSNVREALRGGLTYIGFSNYNSDGRLEPLTGALTAGDQDGSGGTNQLVGAQSAPVPLPETETILWPGDDGVIDSIQVEPEAVGEGVIVTAEFDLDIHAALQGTSVKEIGDMVSGALFPKNPTYSKSCVIINQFKSISRKTDAKGLPVDASYILINAQLVPIGGSPLESRARSDNQYRLTTGKRSRTPWNTSVSTDYGVCETGIIEFHSEYPLDVQSWLGDGAETVFNLGKTPVEASSDKVAVWVDGVLQTYTVNYTVDTSAATITFVAPPANDAYIVALYQYLRDCV
jgi:hypothetical protein